MSSNFMRRSLIEEEEEGHHSDVSDVDSGSDLEDGAPILAPRRVVRNASALTSDGWKPYLQQTQQTKQESQRKLEVCASPDLVVAQQPKYFTLGKCPRPFLRAFWPRSRLTSFSSHDARSFPQTLLNHAAHTPEFQPGVYNAAKLSEDAVRLLADFIQRPSVRKQLTPFVGEIRGKKRKGRPRVAVDGSPTGEPKRKAFISKETGRQVRTRLTEQQIRVLQDKFEEQKHWNPKECTAMLPILNQLGPDLAVDQVSRWFDNRRRPLKPRSSVVMANDEGQRDSVDYGIVDGAMPDDMNEKNTRRLRHGDREILEAAFSQNAAPDIQVRHALATATGLSEKQVTGWFARRQAAKRAPHGIIPGANGIAGLDGKDTRIVLPGIWPNHFAAVHSFGAAHSFMYGGLLQGEYGSANANVHGLPTLGLPLGSLGRDTMRGQ